MSYTYHQAKNPATINITDEHVTESELPERLAELNRKTTALEYDVGNTITEIPKMRTEELRVKGSNMNDVLSITSGMDPHELIMNFYNDKSATCYGALINIQYGSYRYLCVLQ